MNKISFQDAMMNLTDTLSDMDIDSFVEVYNSICSDQIEWDGDTDSEDYNFTQTHKEN